MKDSESKFNIACALPISEQVRREAKLIPDLFKKATKISQLNDGYAFCYTYSDKIALKLLKFISFERNCCPFFTFELVFESRKETIWLKLRGPFGVKDFIKNGIVSILPDQVGSSDRE